MNRRWSDKSNRRVGRLAWPGGGDLFQPPLEIHIAQPRRYLWKNKWNISMKQLDAGTLEQFQAKELIHDAV